MEAEGETVSAVSMEGSAIDVAAMETKLNWILEGMIHNEDVGGRICGPMRRRLIRVD